MVIGVFENEKSTEGFVLIFYLQTAERKRGNLSFRTTEHTALVRKQRITNLQDARVFEAKRLVALLEYKAK
jgi:hypothetical protein